MGHYVLIDGTITIGLLGLWYACFRAYNRHKGAKVLRWIEAACGEKGQITKFRWRGTSYLRVYLHFQSHWFENARVTVRLLPRPALIEWFICFLRKQKETLTFEADLDDAPTLQLDLFRHRWLTHKHIRTDSLPSNWNVTRPGAIVLTTRATWNQEHTPVVNALMSARTHRLFRARLSPASPHLSAAIDLGIVDDEPAAKEFVEVLHELAVGASARQ